MATLRLKVDGIEAAVLSEALSGTRLSEVTVTPPIECDWEEDLGEASVSLSAEQTPAQVSASLEALADEYGEETHQRAACQGLAVKVMEAAASQL